MGNTEPGRAPGTIRPQDREVPDLRPVHDPVTASAGPHTRTGEPGAPPGYSSLPRPLRAVVGTTAGLLVAAALVHVVMVFLYVAPSNEVSQRYSSQINMWIYPLFEQNWRLFAPDPQSATWQISARTIRTAINGTPQVSGWFDLTAVDDSAINHNPYPSRTSQNMLRRAWDAYTASHGNDDQPHSPRALMLQTYLRDIAADRLAAHRPGTFQAIQLRVTTRPIAAPAAPGSPRPNPPTPTDTRYLPWWKVTPDGN
jgi:hypothetical protein